MAEKLKKTRPELLKQRRKLSMFKRFLPTLILKKQQIQSEILKVRKERVRLEEEINKQIELIKDWIPLFGESVPGPVTRFVQVKDIERGIKNIAGIKVPFVENVIYEVKNYSKLVTPPWIDEGLKFVKKLLELREKLQILNEQEKILQQELRKVTQRVNLFEKVMIPNAQDNIKLIRIALAEEQTSAVGRSKIAKSKSAD